MINYNYKLPVTSSLHAIKLNTNKSVWLELKMWRVTWTRLIADMILYYRKHQTIVVSCYEGRHFSQFRWTWRNTLARAWQLQSVVHLQLCSISLCFIKISLNLVVRFFIMIISLLSVSITMEQYKRRTMIMSKTLKAVLYSIEVKLIF